MGTWGFVELGPLHRHPMVNDVWGNPDACNSFGLIGMEPDSERQAGHIQAGTGLRPEGGAAPWRT